MGTKHKKRYKIRSDGATRMKDFYVTEALYEAVDKTTNTFHVLHSKTLTHEEKVGYLKCREEILQMLKNQLKDPYNQ